MTIDAELLKAMGKVREISVQYGLHLDASQASGFAYALLAAAKEAQRDERERLNGEFEERPTRGQLLNIIKGYDNKLLATIVAKHGDKLSPGSQLVADLRKKLDEKPQTVTILFRGGTIDGTDVESVVDVFESPQDAEAIRAELERKRLYKNEWFSLEDYELR